jgi:hypothetical protein
MQLADDFFPSIDAAARVTRISGAIDHWRIS